MSGYTEDMTRLLREDRGLPGRCFTAESFLQLERTQLFERGWMCIGLSADVAHKGDLFPVTILGLPLLMVRDGERLRVFHNVCRHRGAILVETAAHAGPRIVCPYHGWGYRLNGELAATPHVGGPGSHACEGLEANTLGLRPVRSAEWAGHVFVNLSGTAPEFSEWIQPVAARFANVAWGKLRRDRALERRLEVAANWKIVCENFVESYHLPSVHPELNSVNPMAAHYQILGGHSYLGQGGSAYQGEAIADAALPLMPGSSGYSSYESLIVFPNLILGPLPDMTFSIVILPLAAERTAERVSFYFVGEPSLDAQYAAVRSRSADFIAKVNAEDVSIVESVQRGRHSPAFDGGLFAPGQEATSLQFQKMVAAAILSATPGRAEEVVMLETRDINRQALA
jgi:phenylpropionate dioxygenase-like ring-hydroxylating dioxygenase large terminal subunit